MRYAKGVARSGGNMHGRATRYTGGIRGTAPSKPLRVFLKRAAEYGSAECPVCRFEVNLRKDGAIGSHRVGRAAKTATLCPGEGRSL